MRPASLKDTRRPNVAEDALRRAHDHLALGQPKEAIARLRNNPAALSNPVGQLLLAQAYGEVGKTELALASCEAAIRLAPANAEAHYSRGIFLRRMGRL